MVDKLEFALTGRELIEGRGTLIVAFRQKQATPLDARELARRQFSGKFKNGLQRWRGRFWADAGGQIWRIEQERTLEYADTPAPLVVMRGGVYAERPRHSRSQTLRRRLELSFLARQRRRAATRAARSLHR